ncbi:MAG: restriction endonuclease subunit S [Saprospiraceae bacterium]|nr:restriction endonuclease subunit S [Saprospiraceae bacterium]
MPNNTIKSNNNKLFYINYSDVDKRLDPFYYIPELVKLEEKVDKRYPIPLRKFVKSISSGATPKITEKRYYSDVENGIPFIRVQNLSPTGELDLKEIKYIDLKTHNKYLKRSQVKEGDLLIKITGVGRMAVASVAPEGFEGNINQHIVVIRTGSKQVSKVLAAYLNTDICEKLARRRSTGGTRPALDYTALLSIPIIYNKSLKEIIDKSYKKKKEKDIEATKLLDSINVYLSNQLGIDNPDKYNSLLNRIYHINFSDISSKNFSPHYIYLKKTEIRSSKFKYFSLKQIAYMYQPHTITQQDMIHTGKFKVYGANGHIGYYDKFNHINSEIAVTCRGATCGEVNLTETKSWITGNAMVVQIKVDFVQKLYLYEILNFMDLDFVISGSAQPQITRENLMKFEVPIPKLEKQKKIVEDIEKIRKLAKRLQKEGEEVLDFAKREIEKIILGDNSV